MDGKSVDLTIIFVSPQFKDKYEEIPKLIRNRISSGHFLGCSGGGIVGGGKEAEQQAAFSMTCANLPDVEIKGIHTDTMKLPDQDTAPSVWREWLGVDVEKNPSFIFLADPFSFQGEEFLAGVDFAYPNSSKVGGLASGAQAPGGNALYLFTQQDDGTTATFRLEFPVPLTPQEKFKNILFEKDNSEPPFEYSLKHLKEVSERKFKEKLDNG